MSMVGYDGGKTESKNLKEQGERKEGGSGLHSWRCKRWTKSRKKKMPGEMRKNRGLEKHVRWLSGCRTRNSGRHGATYTRTYVHVWPKRALCSLERIQLD